MTLSRITSDGTAFVARTTRTGSGESFDNSYGNISMIEVRGNTNPDGPDGVLDTTRAQVEFYYPVPVYPWIENNSSMCARGFGDPVRPVRLWNLMMMKLQHAEDVKPMVGIDV